MRRHMPPSFSRHVARLVSGSSFSARAETWLDTPSCHADPERRPAALDTIARGELTLQGPMMLKQGFVGIIPRLPIFIANVSDPDETWGSVGTDGRRADGHAARAGLVPRGADEPQLLASA